MKKIKHISFLYGSLIIILSYFLYIAYWANPGYDAEIPFLVQNKTELQVEVRLLITDELERIPHSIFNKYEVTLPPEKEHYFSHPEYDLTKERYSIMQLIFNDQLIYTLTLQNPGKGKIYQIINDPLRIEEISR